MNIIKKLANFFIRSLSSGIKFILIIYLAKILSVEELAKFTFALLIVGFIVTFAPLERHYFLVRKYKDGKISYNSRLIFSHLFRLKINTIVVLVAVSTVGFISICLGYIGISFELLFLIILLSLIEIVNVDYFRYLQLKSGPLFMITQILRNIVPPIIFIFIIQKTRDKYPAEIYLSISFAASFISYYLCERIILGRRRLKIIPIRNLSRAFAKHIDLKSHIKFPILILVLQIMPSYLDRFLIMQSSDKSLFVNYSFYSSISTFFLVFTQAFFVQPRLVHWFENRRSGNSFITSGEIVRVMSVLALLILCLYTILIVAANILPVVYHVSDLHIYLFIGMLFACVNGYLSAFFYSIGLDRKSLVVDTVGFVVFILLCIITLVVGDFRIVFEINMIYGMILFTLRLYFLSKRVEHEF